jgi:hypothetical protein
VQRRAEKTASTSLETIQRGESLSLKAITEQFAAAINFQHQSYHFNDEKEVLLGRLK